MKVEFYTEEYEDAKGEKQTVEKVRVTSGELLLKGNRAVPKEVIDEVVTDVHRANFSAEYEAFSASEEKSEEKPKAKAKKGILGGKK